MHQPPQTPASAITITGCLKQEKDLPKGTQDPQQQSAAIVASASNDFVITDVKMAPGSSTSALALGSIYEIQGLAESDLTKHLNHQVEITGTIATQPSAVAARTDDYPDFQATSVKMIAATCSAK